MHRLISALIGLAFVLVVGSGSANFAAAAQVTYSSLPLPSPETRAADLTAASTVETTFFAALASHGTDTLEEVVSPNLGVINPSLTFGASGVTATTTYSGVFSVPGGLPVSGMQALVEQPTIGTNVITLSQPVTAFGSDFIQVGDSATLSDTVTLHLENTILHTAKDVVVGTAGPGAAFNSVFYFGLTDTDPFNQITLVLSNPQDGVLLDNITVGAVAPVPEPATLTLLACGAALPLLVRYGRRAKKAPTG